MTSSTSQAFASFQAGAISHAFRHILITHSDSINGHDTDVDMAPIPSSIDAALDALDIYYSPPLVYTNVKEKLTLVHARRQKAYLRFRNHYKRYQAIPEDVRTSVDVPLEYREDCHSEFANPPGMYDGVHSQLGEQAELAAAEFERANLERANLERANLEHCWETLRLVMKFLDPIEKKLRGWEKAMRALEHKTKEFAKKEVATKKEAAAKEVAAKEMTAKKVITKGVARREIVMKGVVAKGIAVKEE